MQVDTVVSEDKQVSAHLVYDDEEDDEDEDSPKVFNILYPLNSMLQQTLIINL